LLLRDKFNCNGTTGSVARKKLSSLMAKDAVNIKKLSVSAAVEPGGGSYHV
jgi:hypothetical protein